MSRRKLTRFEELTASLYDNSNNVFRDDEDKSPVTLRNEELDETFFTAQLFTMMLQFNKLTGQDLDIIDFIGTLNKLALQHLLESEEQQ
jgi:hypothetical protein